MCEYPITVERIVQRKVEPEPVISSSSADKPKEDQDLAVTGDFKFVQPASVSISTDKEKYLVGETVHVEVQSPFVPCDGIISVLTREALITNKFAMVSPTTCTYIYYPDSVKLMICLVLTLPITAEWGLGAQIKVDLNGLYKGNPASASETKTVLISPVCLLFRFFYCLIRFCRSKRSCW